MQRGCLLQAASFFMLLVPVLGSSGKVLYQNNWNQVFANLYMRFIFRIMLNPVY